ncbi:MAG: signal peptide peptidase SppA [Flavipsychrobacter sp.]|nr:signal peptide peptidase SppA [Flavipsychrobacter sp.]
MKQFFKMFFASLLAIVVSGVIVFGLLIGMAVSMVSEASDKEDKTVAANSVLVIDLSKRLHEQGEKNSLAAFSNGDAYTAGLYDAVKAITYAKTDDKIKGILIKMNPASNGWATMQQLREAIVDFKRSKKFVYAYGEVISQGAYYIGSAADSVYLNPVGDIELKGMATVIPFFKGTLDKLEIQPEIFYAGKFKSATEPFRAEKMSEPNRLQTSQFLGGFWAEYLTAAAQHAHTDTAAINALAQSGAIQFPTDALQYKLVDGLLYWDEVESRIMGKTGAKKLKDIKYVQLDEYANTARRDKKVNDKKIAVIFAEGSIVDGEKDGDYSIASQDMIETIRKVADNDKVKAVVLRVNSPGGSALASEVILRELNELKKKKPLIVSMGDLAASGGYYISSNADSIFALPNTITGSIGVFGMMFNFGNLMKNKLGVTFDEVKTGPYADFPSAVRPMTEDEGKKMQANVDNIYQLFMSRVAAGRKMNIADVDSIAQGRVWTGTDALRIGLVDGLGDLNRAISSASAKAGLKDYQVVTYPEPVDKLESLMRSLKGNTGAAAAVQTTLKEELGDDYEYYKQVRDLKKMNGKAMMAMPFMMKIK